MQELSFATIVDEMMISVFSTFVAFLIVCLLCCELAILMCLPRTLIFLNMYEELLRMALLCSCRYHAELFMSYCMTVVLRHQSA